MPEISRFFGMVMAMYYSIDPIALLAGQLSPKAHALVLEWAALHQAELMADWQLARQQAPLNKIDPLE